MCGKVEVTFFLSMSSLTLFACQQGRSLRSNSLRVVIWSSETLIRSLAVVFLITCLSHSPSLGVNGMRVDDPTQLSWEHVHLVDYNVVPRQLDPFHYSRWTMTTSRNHGTYFFDFCKLMEHNHTLAHKEHTHKYHCLHGA